MSSPNLGYLFYKNYYLGIDLRQVSKPNEKVVDKKRQKKISESNSEKFKEKNKEILKTQIDKALIQTLYRNPVAELQSITMTTIYPGLLIGSGYLHETGSEGEFKLGFFFDYTTGYPVLPGSSVKGTLRSLFPSFESLENDSFQANLKKADEVAKNKAKYIWMLLENKSNDTDFTEADYHRIHQLEQSIFAGLDLKNRQLDLTEKQFLPQAKRVLFFDALPHPEKNIGKQLLAEDAITPHDKNPLKNPIPLKMLKVAPGISWVFRFRLQDILWSDGQLVNKTQLLNLFTQILLDQGIGAKTNVGYGQLVEPPKPIVFEKYQEVEGIVSHKKKTPRLEVHFEIEGNNTLAVAAVNTDQYYDLETGDKCLLKITSVNAADGSVKYVQVL